MASIIDKTYFFTGLEVPQVSNPSVEAKLNLYIAQWEPIILEGLMGYELYKSFEAGRIIDPIPDRIADILNGKEYEGYDGRLKIWKGIRYSSGTSKISLLANFVYYKYISEDYTTPTAGGEKKTDTQNSVETSPKQRLFSTWNKMVDMNRDLVAFLERFPDVYPEFIYYNGSRVQENYLSRANHLF